MVACIHSMTRRGSAAAGLAFLVALLLAAAARADTAQVNVVSPGGTEQTLALEALAGSEDVIAKPYVLRGSGGEATEAVTGFSLAKLIAAAGADPYSFSYLEVQRPGGGAVLLSRHQALDQGAFAEGPPVVYAASGGTGFLRPSSGTEDANGDDSFLAPQGVTLVLRKGTPLRVKAEASTLKTKPGKQVEFSAVVEQAGAGEQLSYAWNFDDGKSAQGETVSHKFAERGSYKVVLGVTSPGNEAGSSAVVTIQVGAPIAGPDRKGGGRNEKQNAPDHGAAAGPSTGNGSSGGNSPGVPPDPVAAVPANNAARFESPAPPDKGTTQPEGEEVSGELLTASSAPAPQRDRQQAEARRGSLDGEGGDSGGGVPAAAWGGLAALGLLGLGSLLEARGLGGLLSGRRQGGIA